MSDLKPIIEKQGIGSFKNDSPVAERELKVAPKTEKKQPDMSRLITPQKGDAMLSEKMKKDLQTHQKGKTSISLTEKIALLKKSTNECRKQKITSILGDKKKYQHQFKKRNEDLL